MPVSKANQRAVAKYVKHNYDRIELKVSKGKKNTLQAHAAGHGESLNKFVNRAIDEAVERDKFNKAFDIKSTVPEVDSE